MKEITLHKAFKLFEEECMPYERYAYRTIVRYQGLMKKLIKDFGKTYLFKDLTKIEINKRYFNPEKRNSCRVDMTYINRIGNWLHENYPGETTFKKIKLPKLQKSSKNPLSEQQLHTIFSHPGICQITKYIMQLYILTGCRISELCRPDFTWEQIYIHKGMAKIKNKGHKKSTDVRLEIPFEGNHLKLIQNINDYYKTVHPEADIYPIPASQKSIRNRIDVASKIAGFKFTTHDLRDTSATMMLRETANIYAVKEHLGHSNVQVTQDAYADWNIQDKTKAVHSIESKILSLAVQPN